MVLQRKVNLDFREEERLTCVLVLDSFNTYANEIVSHTSIPLCLWPVNGRPLLDYTIHTLIRSGIQEIILLATTHSDEIRSYIRNNEWLRSYPKLIELISCNEALSLGDCLKDLERKNIINNHFLLLYGNGTLLTNENLNDLFHIHKENIKNDKNCIMTLVYRQLDSNHFKHPSYTDDQYLYIIRDANTHRLYDYSKEYHATYKIPLELLETSNVTIETLYCPLDCHLAVCTLDVLHLFKDNFDFLTINKFVKGVLLDEVITGHTIYSYLYEKGYFLSVHNLYLYMKATFDILRRWTYPLVPEIATSLQKQSSLSVATPQSPQIKLNDSSLLNYNIFHPIIYDKHNIYKQGEVQLDRLSNIQQDVFIGHKSQILSGVSLRSSCIGQSCIVGKNTHIENSIVWNQVQIGENCIIKNSIICDNVLIRNGVQIDEECIICRNVILGTNIHIKRRMTIIASNSTTSMATIDDIEIDDDSPMPSNNFRRSNSKQRSSSARLSEKSLSDRSIGSITDETITSNTDLVGMDGFGRKLSFTAVHDDPTQNAEPINDDEHDDDDNDDDVDVDKSQTNVFDAWGHRTKPIECTDDETGNEIRSPNKRLPDTPPGSGRSTTDGTNTPTDSSATGINNVSEFEEEVIRTLERAYIQKPKIENIIVELNILKPTYDVSPIEFDQAITRAIFLLPFEKKITNSEKVDYWTTLKLTMDQLTKSILKNYMRTSNEQAQIRLLNQLDLICLEYIHPIGERILNILHYLYDHDVVDEERILQWYENKQEQIKKDSFEMNPEEKVYYDKLKQFIEWLQNAEIEEDDDDDSNTD